MLLETMLLEEEPRVFSKETMHVSNVPVVNLDQNGNHTVSYHQTEFSTLEFYGRSYKNVKTSLGYRLTILPWGMLIFQDGL